MRRLLLACVFVAGCATTPKGPVYLVKVEKGDTLASIATQYDTSWDKIADLNGMKDGSELKVGKVVRVRPGPGGMVAQEGGRAAPKARAKKSSIFAKSAPAAGADEFTDADIPAGEENAADVDPDHPVERPATTPKKGGLLFGKDGDDAAALTWPLRGELSSHYGKRGRRMHRGIDIRAPRGTPVRAAGSGVVEFAGRKRGYGKTVIIKHASLRTLYAHLNDIDVAAGETVTAATRIGEVGTTGNASGPHLHLEIRTKNDAAIDPLTVLEEEKLVSAR